MVRGLPSGYKRRARNREWEDPTFAAVVRRITAVKVSYSHVITHEAGGKRRFWQGSRWVVALGQAQRYGSEFSAWDVAECLQDGHVEVELLPE